MLIRDNRRCQLYNYALQSEHNFGEFEVNKAYVSTRCHVEFPKFTSLSKKLSLMDNEQNIYAPSRSPKITFWLMISKANFCLRSKGSKNCKWCLVGPIKTRLVESWCQIILLDVASVLKPIMPPSSSKFEVKILMLLLAVQAKREKKKINQKNNKQFNTNSLISSLMLKFTVSSTKSKL